MAAPARSDGDAPSAPRPLGHERRTGRRRRPDGVRPPPLVVVLAVVAVALFAVPLAALVWKAPWSSAWAELTSGEARTALRLSLESSLLATGLCLVLGLPLAWVQARVPYPG